MYLQYTIMWLSRPSLLDSKPFGDKVLFNSWVLTSIFSVTWTSFKMSLHLALSLPAFFLFSLPSPPPSLFFLTSSSVYLPSPTFPLAMPWDPQGGSLLSLSGITASVLRILIFSCLLHPSRQPLDRFYELSHLKPWSPLTWCLPLASFLP